MKYKLYYKCKHGGYDSMIFNTEQEALKYFDLLGGMYISFIK